MDSENIILYALSTCSHCKRAKELLEGCGVRYNCIFVDRLAGEERTSTVEALKKINPRMSFPTLLIGEEAIVGFKQEAIKEALEKK